MQTLLSTIRRIPYSAGLLVLFTLAVNTLYLVYRYQSPYTGEVGEPVNGHWIINYNTPGGPVDQAGIEKGDTLVSCNGIPVEEWVLSYHGTKAGDTLIFGTLKQHREVGIPVITSSRMSVYPVYYWTGSILAILISMLSLFFLAKKPNDLSIFLFFVYIQLFAITSGTGNIIFREPVFIFANLSYILGSCLMGPVLVHFHSLFPHPVFKIFQKKSFSGFFYSFGLIIFIYSTISYYTNFNPFSGTRWQFNLLDRIVFFWIILCFIVAMVIVITKYLTEKSTLVRNQMLIILLGSLLGLFTPMLYGIFYDYFNNIWIERPYLKPIFIGSGNLFMITCILIAIFRYRIWDIEIVIRKALLYLGATAVVLLSYLFLIWFVDRFIVQETSFIRFAILAISVFLFLVTRDRLQRLIDRLFHREIYDSASVVSDFESRLAGIYRFDELKEKIVQSIDEIFHFKCFVFNLKTKGLTYEPVFALGTGGNFPRTAYDISPELEERLQKMNVFSPEELSIKPHILEEINGELIVPMVEDGQPGGFFICGQKKSERIYSRQDIQVLKLLAQRVVSLLHTAGLYQKEVDRQLMLERERTRISQDMHDDVGASLTRISILSEMAMNKAETDKESKQWLEQISTTSRNVTEEMSQIIWALNPKNDTLEGLIAYIRRFTNEYLEPTSIHCSFDLPEKLPDVPISVEVRRNIYLVVREALHNVVKHSGATQVVISLTLQPFTLSIRDNGTGFKPEKAEFPGNGLINMKKRIHDISGTISIISRIGDGTVIHISLPMK